MNYTKELVANNEGTILTSVIIRLIVDYSASDGG